MSLLGRLYSRRIVNVNVNVVLAGILALIPLTIAVHFVAQPGRLERKLSIAIFTFFADITFDVAIYYILHWLANHGPGRKPAHLLEAGAQPSFFKDATYVQFQRAAISPILYAIALGGQATLINKGWQPAWATAAGFALGIGAARALHTIWLLRDERRAKKKRSARHAAAA